MEKSLRELIEERNSLIREIWEKRLTLPTEFSELDSDNIKKTYSDIQDDIDKLKNILNS